MIDEKENILQPEPLDDLTDEQVKQNFEADVQEKMNRALSGLATGLMPDVSVESFVEGLNKAKAESEQDVPPPQEGETNQFRDERIDQPQRFQDSGIDQSQQFRDERIKQAQGFRDERIKQAEAGRPESVDDGRHTMLEDRSGERGYHEFGEDRSSEEGYHGLGEDRSGEKGYHGINENRSEEEGYHEFGEDRTGDAHFRGMGESLGLTEAEQAQVERENREATEHNLREKIKAFRATGWGRAANEAANQLRQLDRPDGNKDGKPQRQDRFIADEGGGDRLFDPVSFDFDFRYDGKIFNTTAIFDVNFSDAEKGAEHLWIKVPYTATSWSAITVVTTEFTETSQPDEEEYFPIVEGGILVQNSHIHVPQL